MSEHYLMLRTDTGEQVVVGAQGREVLLKDKWLKDKVEELGECNAAGVLLKGIKKNNFLSNEKETRNSSRGNNGRENKKNISGDSKTTKAEE